MGRWKFIEYYTKHREARFKRQVYLGLKRERRRKRPVVQAMLSSPYFQHALYSIACLSISINLVGMRRSTEEEKSRAKARISILESVKEQLAKRPQDNSDLQSKELVERLMKLANKKAEAAAAANKVLGDDVSWGDIFSGRTPSVVVGKEEMSRWEREDLEKCAQLCSDKVQILRFYFFLVRKELK